MISRIHFKLTSAVWEKPISNTLNDSSVSWLIQFFGNKDCQSGLMSTYLHFLYRHTERLFSLKGQATEAISVADLQQITVDPILCMTSYVWLNVEIKFVKYPVFIIVSQTILVLQGEQPLINVSFQNISSDKHIR